MKLTIHYVVPRSRMVETSLHSSVSSWHGAYLIRHRDCYFVVEEEINGIQV